MTVYVARTIDNVYQTAMLGVYSTRAEAEAVAEEAAAADDYRDPQPFVDEFELNALPLPSDRSDDTTAAVTNPLATEIGR